MYKERQIEEFHLPVPWGHIAAKAWGSSKGIPVLVAHGRLDNAGSFNRLIPQLPDAFYFVCIDLPGHGHSSYFPIELPLDFFNYIFAIRSVLDELRWKTCIYIGHSFGAQLGAIFSILYPERIEKIVCLDAIPLYPLLSNTDLVNYIRKCHELTTKAQGAASSSKTYTREEVLHSLKFMRFNAINSEAADALFKRAVTKVGDVYKYNRDPRLKNEIKPVIYMSKWIPCISQFKTPILILIATATIDKAIAGTDSNEINKLISQHSENIIIVEGNHDVHNNCPERVAPHICKFLLNYKSNL